MPVDMLGFLEAVAEEENILKSTYFDFLWYVFEDGYQWITIGPPTEEPPLCIYLTARDPLEVQRCRRFRPLQNEPELFRKFAKIDPTDRNQILAFVCQYGWLGEPEKFDLPEPPCSLGEPEEFVLPGCPEEKGVPKTALGEPYTIWKNEIREMREALQMWEARDDEEKLKRLIQWREDEGPPSRKVIYFTWQEDHRREAINVSLHTIAGPDPFSHTDRLQHLEPGKLTYPAPGLYYLEDVINRHLKFNEDTARVSPCVVVRKGKRKEHERFLDIYFVPRNLIGALWFQFACFVAKNAAYRLCQRCGKQFLLEKDGKDSKDYETKPSFCITLAGLREQRGRS